MLDSHPPIIRLVLPYLLIAHAHTITLSVDILPSHHHLWSIVFHVFADTALHFSKAKRLTIFLHECKDYDHVRSPAAQQLRRRVISLIYGKAL